MGNNFCMKKTVSKEGWFRRILIFIFLVAVSAISNALFNPQEEKLQESADQSFEMQCCQHQCVVQNTVQWEKLDTEHLPSSLSVRASIFQQQKVAIEKCNLEEQEQYIFVEDEFLLYRAKLRQIRQYRRQLTTSDCDILAA